MSNLKLENQKKLSSTFGRLTNSLSQQEEIQTTSESENLNFELGKTLGAGRSGKVFIGYPTDSSGTKLAPKNPLAELKKLPKNATVADKIKTINDAKQSQGFAVKFFHTKGVSKEIITNEIKITNFLFGNNNKPEMKLRHEPISYKIRFMSKDKNLKKGTIYLDLTENSEKELSLNYRLLNLAEIEVNGTIKTITNRGFSLEKLAEFYQQHGRKKAEKKLKKYLPEILYETSKKMHTKPFWTQMEYLEGNPLSNFYIKNVSTGKEVPNSEIRELAFSKRTQLIFQLVEQIFTWHRNGIIHGDINIDNVLTDLKNCYLIDPGDSFEFTKSRLVPSQQDAKLKTENQGNKMYLHPFLIEGGSCYHPPETRHAQYCLKSDIFMLVYPILSLLLEPNPLKLKSSFYDKVKSENSLTDEDVEISDHKSTSNKEPLDCQYLAFNNLGVMEFPANLQPSDEFDIRNVILQFLDIMSDPDYRNRPEDEDVLAFFHCLHKLALCAELQSQFDYDKGSLEWNTLQTQKLLLCKRLSASVKGDDFVTDEDLSIGLACS
ncbi:MAG TPA: hypothetical protein VHE99_05060 [Gammaproteobacteria bacterium]|nr:hypothetical protein [Gammaproteobacteria bacterium]